MWNKMNLGANQQKHQRNPQDIKQNQQRGHKNTYRCGGKPVLF